MPNITKRFVDAAGPGRHYDDRLAGFGLYVGTTGARSYFFEYRPGHGRGIAKRRISIGRHGSPWTADQAREKALQHAIAVKAGRDPLDERETKARARTVAEVAEEWLRRDQAGNRSRAEVERLLRRDVLPVLGSRAVETIRKRDILELIDGIADRGAPIMANRVLAHVKRLFRWAAGRDIIEADPAAHVEKPSPERRRERVLSDDELVAVWRAAERLGGPFGAGVRLLITTGARREEVFGLRWSEIDRDAAVIRLPAERNKVAEERLIPLSPLALAVLDDLPQMGICALTTTGASPFANIGKSKAALDTLAEVSGWRLHDLRRTTATGLQRLGVRLEVIEAVLGHVSGSRAGIVGVYQRHRFTDEARTALVAWGAQVDRLLAGGKGADVVPMRRTRRGR